ncbi:DUF3108 domain-containing protein [Chitinophaga tropicalis]|uniref:Uncharacterized protein n=1 Tax=Chitinophaga tropicalis TaxID=2683588 RepID=A0A7K1U1Q8_9BACT|nr:hypothetical protein [Chitinophaga tropicalis]MVT08273.1 hypothetical protein [Chitinophaga tropicalis]
MMFKRFKPCLISAALLIVALTAGKAQTVLVPGENVFDKKFIKNSTYEMACYANINGQDMEVSSFNIQIIHDSKTLAVYTTLRMTGAKELSMDTSIADWNTFKPIYRSSSNQTRDMVLHFGKEVTGYYYDKQNKKRYPVKDPVNSGSFFDSYAYPYILGLLPLTTGYKNDIAVYDFKPENSTNTKVARIEEVKSNLYKSNLTDDHKVWQVSIFEEATNDRYLYYIDKDTRRLWKIVIQTRGQQLVLVDKEIDYNPFTTRFDKAQTLKMVTSGNSIILGQAFARDNQNTGVLRKMAVANINKKQYARAGTSVVLIPYTPFFKEWIKLNKESRKKGKSIPLPEEAAECIKVATVYDDDGHFEFTSLMPGEYLLYTEFGYTHKASRTEITGYTDTYINGIFQGTSPNTTTYNYNTTESAAIQKTITIKADGEKAEVKLRQL